MTEKLGVLLVDVPEPRIWECSYLEYSYGTHIRWVSLEEL